MYLLLVMLQILIGDFEVDDALGTDEGEHFAVLKHSVTTKHFSGCDVTERCERGYERIACIGSVFGEFRSLLSHDDSNRYD